MMMPQRRAKILRLLRQTKPRLSFTAIARRCGVSRGTISGLAARNGIRRGRKLGPRGGVKNDHRVDAAIPAWMAAALRKEANAKNVALSEHVRHIFENHFVPFA